LFTVRHDADKPFRVHIAGAIVEDVGTEFGVRAYTRADTVQVVVTSGLVLLRRAAAPADTAGVIRASEIGLLAASGAALVSSVSNAAELLAWSTGQLTFDETLMSNVAAEIKRWYDVDVTVDSALAGRRISVGFNGESIDDVSRVIAKTIDARVERNGRVVAFRVNGAPK
jgi:transmembrane sensor